ncbi:MAG: hypothetical protein A4E60_02826 [Syntrophorhabdus sp. PtaB.Bin047]|jgi:hypothetical protein|nr:MAG: hypothetical protein A4E60_02826 [Syntrophorhabdus sp. PtaB.Bin047]
MKDVTTVLVILLLLAAVHVCAGNLSEAARIQYLIASVEALEGAKFIRNGSEHDARAAADHLRLKLKVAGNKVKTAEDFIKYCASRSSMTGEPYLIRFADGTTVRSEVFFRNRLRTFAGDKPQT